MSGSPYRAAPPRGTGLADRPFTAGAAKFSAGVFGCFGLLMWVPMCLVFSMMTYTEYRSGDDAWQVFAVAALASPFVTLFVLGVAVGFSVLRTRTAFPERQVLDPLQERLGGELIEPRWFQIGVKPELRTDIDGHAARLVALLIRRSPQSRALAGALEEPWARMGNASLLAQNTRLNLLTNLHAPFDVTFISRTKVAGLLSKTPEVRLPEPVGARIACFTQHPERLGRLCQDPAFVEAVRALVESNLPYLTSLALGPAGAHWASLVTDQTHAEAMRWRVGHIAFIAERLRAV